ncbi:unnamed protein product [Closterium sp. NIES-53]
MLPSLPAQSNYATAFDTLQRPVEATHMLDVASRLHFDERFLRPHQMVGATAVEQHHHWVRLHSGRGRLEVLASLLRQRDCRLHHADYRARRLPVASAFASEVVGVLRRRSLLRHLLLLARLLISTGATTGRPTMASLVVLVAVIAARALVGEVVRVVADPTLPPSTTTSSTLVPHRPLLVDVLRRPPTSATTSARLPALHLLTIRLRRCSVTCLRKELRGVLCLLHSLVLKDVAGDGVLVEGLTRVRHHHHPLHEVVAARQALDDMGDVGRRRVFGARHPHLSQDPSSTVAVVRRRLLLSHPNACHLLLQLSDV